MSYNRVYTAVTQWHCRYGNGLVIHRWHVQVLARHHCVVALGKLLTPAYLRHQAV